MSSTMGSNIRTYVLFSRIYRSEHITNHSGISLMSKEETEAAWRRSAAFLMDQMKELVNQYSWIEKPTDDSMMFHIATKVDNPLHPGLRLPQSFEAFSDPSQASKWYDMFYRIFEARCPDGDKRALVVDGPAALSNVFYLLQVLAPGMLVIFRRYDTNDVNIKMEETSRILPPKEWVEAHQEILEHVLSGSKTSYNDILAATSDVSQSFRENSTDSDIDEDYEYNDEDWDDSSYYTDMWGQRQPKDLTACDKECGYCGQCDY